MRQTIGFWKPKLFDPLTLTTSSYFRESFGNTRAGYWYSETTAAGGATPRQVSYNGFSAPGPAAGVVLDGYTCQQISGGTQSAALSRGNSDPYEPGTGGASDIGNYLTSSAYTVFGLAKVTTTFAPAANSYQNGSFLNADARWGLFFNTSGLGIWHYTGTFPTVQRAQATNVWFFFCARYDSTSGKVQIDLNNSPGANTALGALAAFNPIQAYEAINSFGGNNNSYQLREFGTVKARWSDTDRDNYYGYLRAKYPTAALP